MAIGNLNNVPGSGFANFGQSVGNSLTESSQNATDLALRLKMQSVLLRQQQAMEQEKFQREQTLNPDVAGSFLDILSKPRKIGQFNIPGLDVSGVDPKNLSIQEANELRALYQDQSNRVMMSSMMRGGVPKVVRDDTTGVPIRTDFENPMMPGMVVRSEQNQGYNQQRQQWVTANAGKDALNAISAAYAQVDPRLLGPLAAKGGSIIENLGGLVPGTDQSWVKQQQVAIQNLQNTINEQGPTLGIALSRVSPGRFIHNLSQQIQDRSIGLQTLVKNFQNIRDNAQFRFYTDQKLSGGNTDPNDEAKFGNLPVGKGGGPLPVAFYNGMAIPEDQMDKVASNISGSPQVGGATSNPGGMFHIDDAAFDNALKHFRSSKKAK